MRKAPGKTARKPTPPSGVEKISRRPLLAELCGAALPMALACTATGDGKADPVSPEPGPTEKEGGPG